MSVMVEVCLVKMMLLEMQTLKSDEKPWTSMCQIYFMFGFLLLFKCMTNCYFSCKFIYGAVVRDWIQRTMLGI